jgi:hypothetical protein
MPSPKLDRERAEAVTKILLHLKTLVNQEGIGTFAFGKEAGRVLGRPYFRVSYYARIMHNLGLLKTIRRGGSGLTTYWINLKKEVVTEEEMAQLRALTTGNIMSRDNRETARLRSKVERLEGQLRECRKERSKLKSQLRELDRRHRAALSLRDSRIEQLRGELADQREIIKRELVEAASSALRNA